MWGLLTDAEGRRAVEVAERHADRGAADRQLRSANVAAARASADHDPMAGLDEYRADQALTAALNASGDRPRLGYAAECAADAAEDKAAEEAAQADLLRCVIGNPFHPVSPGPWVTPAAVTVAQDIYDRRDFSALRVLADLLEEAGCPEQSVLDHCRRPGEHARGCWAVDLVLGKG